MGSTLFDSEPHLAAIVESSDDAIISKSLDGIVWTWNSGAERLYGYSALEAIGQHMTFLLPQDRVDEETEILERINRGHQVEHYQTVRVRKDGQQIDVSLSISPIRSRDGEIFAISHIARDITEQKRAEAAIRESEAKLRAYLECASQGVITVDAGGRIDMVNAQIEQMFGYQRDELLGESLEILLPERFRGVHTGHRAEYFSNPRARPMGLGLDLFGLRKDGMEFPIEIALSHISAHCGPLAIAFVSDITARKQLEEQLRQRQKLESLGVLAGGVAHDFNNLLTGILGNASLVLEMFPPTNPGREKVRNILDASERAAHLIRQLLAYAGKARFVVEPVHLSALVRTTSELIQMSIPKAVQLRLLLQDDLPSIEGDTSQLQQIIMNLVINGAEAISDEKEGTVLVTTSVEDINKADRLNTAGSNEIRPGRYVNLEIHDNGCGMDPATIFHIFDPFFTTKFTGRGLGLAAVQGIVRRHRGIINVSSEVGQGTTFKLLFPASKHVSFKASDQAPEELPVQSGNATILVIDEDQLVRHTAATMLEYFGYRVIMADNGKEGVYLFEVLADKVSLVLLNVTMPLMGGEETLQRIQQIRPDVKVILTSGLSEADASLHFTRKGPGGFLQKPYDAGALDSEIRAVLGRR